MGGIQGNQKGTESQQQESPIQAGEQEETRVIVNKPKSPYLDLSISVWYGQLIHNKIEMVQNANRNTEQEQEQRREIGSKIETEMQNGMLIHKAMTK